LELATTTYRAFNLSHCHDYLVANHGITVSYDCFRKWCIKAGLGRRHKRRPSKARLHRERMAHEGVMLQLDGSPHRWNGKDEWCLIAGIDDATSTMAGARFFPTETTWGCFAVLRTIIERYGIPEIIYTDNAGWAGGGEKRRFFTQFIRACEELGISLITTSSPEAKGRIERAFRTTQGRLVAELALNGITGMVDANRYLEQVYLPKYWNARLTVEARSPTSRYRGLRLDQKLDDILCFQHKRRVNRNHTVSLGAKIYRIRNPELGSLSGKEVTAHVTEAQEVTWHYGKHRLTTELITKPTRRWRHAG
jgi:hypothetical protein